MSLSRVILLHWMCKFDFIFIYVYVESWIRNRFLYLVVLHLLLRTYKESYFREEWPLYTTRIRYIILHLILYKLIMTELCLRPHYVTTSSDELW